MQGNEILENCWILQDLQGMCAFRPLRQVETVLPSHLHIWTTVHLTMPVFQANNDILAFLSGMPVTRNTKYLDLKNSVSGESPPLPSASLPPPHNCVVPSASLYHLPTMAW